MVSVSHLSVLSKTDGSGLHVQDAGDEVSLSEAAQSQCLLTVVIEVSAVGPVQPHVWGGAVVEVMHGPTRHAHTRALVAAIFFHNVKLGKNKMFRVKQSQF